jgi:hypothetical protein
MLAIYLLSLPIWAFEKVILAFLFSTLSKTHLLRFYMNSYADF